MAFWLDPYKDKSSREALKLMAQIAFSFLTAVFGACLIVYGINNNHTLALSMGAGFVGTGIGTWVSP
jgi:hypothetical protein